MRWRRCAPKPLAPSASCRLMAAQRRLLHRAHLPVPALPSAGPQLCMCVCVCMQGRCCHSTRSWPGCCAATCCLTTMLGALFSALVFLLACYFLQLCQMRCALMEAAVITDCQWWRLVSPHLCPPLPPALLAVAAFPAHNSRLATHPLLARRYGCSTGTPTASQTLADCAAVLALLQNQLGKRVEDTVLYGQSGGWVQLGPMRLWGSWASRQNGQGEHC